MGTSLPLLSSHTSESAASSLEFYDFLRTNLQKPSDVELVNRRVLPERGDCGVVETEDWTLHLQVHTTNGCGEREGG